jgi:hypothetical protein
MAQDIRKLLENDSDVARDTMPKGHKKRFAAKLAKALPAPKKSLGWMKIAASIVALLSISAVSYYLFKPSENTAVVNTQQQDESIPQITLGDISPDLKKIESYYVANINVALSELEFDKNNQQLFNSYMTRLAELNDEYQKLNKELNEVGPNEQTINALIGNLQLRLQLLYQLKEKLNQLKESKDENRISKQI